MTPISFAARAGATVAVLGAAALLAGIAPKKAEAKRDTAPWAVVVPSMEKVRPGPAPRGERRIRLVAARGECEAAQIVAHGVKRLTPTARPPTLGERRLEPVLYRVGFLDVKHPSNDEGAKGLWPDPLIPQRDVYRGEKRRAFPASAEGKVPVIVYYELCVPEDAAPGRYSGAVRLTAENRSPLQVPVEVRVLEFALPATATFPASFGFPSRVAALGHGLPIDENMAKMTRLYGEAALRHRISFHGLSFDAPPFMKRGRELVLDFREFDAEIGPFLEGEILPNGARFTSFTLQLHPKARSDDDVVAYWRAFAAHLRRRGWLDRAFIYAKDEPKPEELPEVRRFTALAKKADPALRVLVTTSFAPILAGLPGIWAPNINCLFVRPFSSYCGSTVPLKRYASERRSGARMWWYQSCGSHGCGEPDPFDIAARRYFRGWPSYMVDHDAALNRAMGPLAFRFGVDGELYFNTLEAWVDEDGENAGDPWRSIWRFTGNGDGTLFYPGTPERIGGRTHIPIESLRLKHIRDGLEDYEYLHLARSLGLQREADAFARALTPQPFEIERSARAWQKARLELAGKLEAAWRKRSESNDGERVEGR